MNVLKMPEDTDEPSSSNNTDVPDTVKAQTVPEVSPAPSINGQAHEEKGALSWLKDLFKGKPDPTLREAIEEYIEEPESYEDEPTISAEERAILSNILELQTVKVIDVMVPRADIIALDVNTTKEQLFELLSEKQFSRIPVYKETLDDVLGTIHIKDVMAALAKGENIIIADMLTGVPIVSPSMSIMDLVLKMRQSRRHMVMVVDEYGGIDGLVTIGDIIEFIIGEIDDEHDTDAPPEIVKSEDGSVVIDGRLDLNEFEETFGLLLSDEDREDSDTMGGLVSTIAGRVPARGEILTHESGMEFEVLDADPRRVHRVKISKIPVAAE